MIVESGVYHDDIENVPVEGIIVFSSSSTQEGE
jgi:hypothetical protein